MEGYAIFVEGISELESFDELTPNIELNAARAINKITRDGRVRASREIREEINVPARFVSPSGKRLYVGGRAVPGNLQNSIRARSRATSLARFVQGTPRRGRGVTVEVKPGLARYMRRAFLIKLPQGSGGVDTKFNSGLAVRLGPGEKLSNKVRSVRLDSGLHLLYGPSVDQVFIDKSGSGVAEDISDDLANDLAGEFARLMEVDF